MSALVSSRRKKLWVIHPNRTVFSQNNCSLGVTLYVRHVIWWTIFWLDWAYYWSLCTKHALQHIWSILYPEQSILVLYNWYTLINPSLSEVLFADWMQFGVKKDPTLQLTQVFFLLCYSKGVSSDIWYRMAAKWGRFNQRSWQHEAIKETLEFRNTDGGNTKRDVFRAYAVSFHLISLLLF